MCIYARKWNLLREHKLHHCVKFAFVLHKMQKHNPHRQSIKESCVVWGLVLKRKRSWNCVSVLWNPSLVRHVGILLVGVWYPNYVMLYMFLNMIFFSKLVCLFTSKYFNSIWEYGLHTFFVCFHFPHILYLLFVHFFISKVLPHSFLYI